ncbi:hypothetical protein HN51_045568 [Arachis hypogaea]
MLWHSIFFLFNWNLFYYHVSLQDDIRIVPKLRYDIPRHQVKQVICSLCGTEQEVSKKQYHCGGCGICRTGGSENCFHRDKCVQLHSHQGSERSRERHRDLTGSHDHTGSPSRS